MSSESASESASSERDKIKEISLFLLVIFFLSFPFGLLIGSVGLLQSKGAFQSQKLLFSFRNLPSHIYFPLIKRVFSPSDWV